MTTIFRSNGIISCNGHAGDKVPCAMLTALTVALVTNITERLGEKPGFVLDEGVFSLDTHKLSPKAMELVDAYVYALKGLAESYPNNFEYCID